jgi:hypothetical protein
LLSAQEKAAEQQKHSEEKTKKQTTTKACCPFTKLRCLLCNKDSAVVERRHLAEHQASPECRQASAVCRFCKAADLKAGELRAHWVHQCRAIPIECDLCGANSSGKSNKSLTRASLLMHKLEACPAVLMNCPYSFGGTGCTVRLSRVAMMDHLQRTYELHLKFLQLRFSLELAKAKHQILQTSSLLMEAKSNLADTRQELSATNVRLRHASEVVAAAVQQQEAQRLATATAAAEEQQQQQQAPLSDVTTPAAAAAAAAAAALSVSPSTATVPVTTITTLAEAHTPEEEEEEEEPLSSSTAAAEQQGSNDHFSY